MTPTRGLGRAFAPQVERRRRELRIDVWGLASAVYIDYNGADDVHRKGGTVEKERRDLHVLLSAGTADYLESLAAEHGLYSQRGGHRHGRPSITKLLEMVGSGELVIVPRQEALPGFDVSVAEGPGDKT